jgi:hypothetical protein
MKIMFVGLVFFSPENCMDNYIQTVREKVQKKEILTRRELKIAQKHATITMEQYWQGVPSPIVRYLDSDGVECERWLLPHDFFRNANPVQENKRNTQPNYYDESQQTRRTSGNPVHPERRRGLHLNRMAPSILLQSVVDAG